MSQRVESGPIAFDHCGPQGAGYDLPGVFLRGDLCFAMHAPLRAIVAHYKEAKPGFWSKRDASYVEQLLAYMEEANVN